MSNCAFLIKFIKGERVMKIKVNLIIVIFCLAIIGFALNLDSQTVYAEDPIQEVSTEGNDYVAPGKNGRVNLTGDVSYGITNEYYIPNWNYFYSNPKHAENKTSDNPNGTCTTVAMQMLLSYHNYYSDRRLIPEFSSNGERYLSQEYGDINFHPSITCESGYNDNGGLGSGKIGTEDAVFYGIFKSAWHADWSLMQNIGNIVNGANTFINQNSPEIAENVSLYEDHYTKEDAKAELDAGRPIILGFKPAILGGESQNSFHVVVAYGYAELDGIFGFIVHCGWSYSDRYIWVPHTWVGFEVKMSIAHEHNFSTTNDFVNNAYRVKQCSECGYKAVDEIFEIYETNNSTCSIAGVKIKLSDVVLPNTIAKITTPKESKYLEIIFIGYNAFENNFTIKNITIHDNILQIGASAFKNCRNLESVKLSAQNSKLIRIEDNAFERTKITSFDIPKNVKYMGKLIFAGCSNLECINFYADDNNGDFTFEVAAFSWMSSEFSVNIMSVNVPPYLFYNNKNIVKVALIGEKGKTQTIGGYAFYGCEKLSEIEFSTQLNSIGESSFNGCTSLTRIDFPSSLEVIGDYAFNGCTSLTRIDFPSSLEVIGDYAFNGCTSLMSIDFLSSLKTIGNYVFNGCTSLINIDFPSSLEAIGNHAFSGCTGLTSIEFPTSLINIGEYAFSDCTGFTSITTPNSLQSIGNYAFKGCKNLTEIYIGFGFDTENDKEYDLGADALPFADIGSESLTAYFICERIPDYIFRKFQGEVYVGENVKTIGPNSFYDCDMTSIYISSGVESIGNGAFGKCNNLVEITVSPDNPIYKSENNCLIRKAKNILLIACKTSVIPSYVDMIADFAYRELDITSLTIPNTVTFIAGGAFDGCTELRYISLPIGEEEPAWNSFFSLLGSSGNPGMTVNITNGTVVHEDAFFDCDNIETIILPDTIEVFENNAFTFCSSLRRINSPENLREIHSAFVGCQSLKAFKIPSTVTLIAAHSFGDCNSLQLVELQRTAAQGITVIEKGAFGDWQQNYLQQDYTNIRAITVNDMDSYDSYVAQFESNNEPQLVDLVTYRELRYTLLDDDSYSVSRGRAYLNGTIEIPAYFKGKPVTTIGQNAFKDCGITVVTIPSTVTEIKSGAFDGCSNFDTIQIQRNISLGLVNISDDNFANLSRIILPDSITYEAYKSNYPQYTESFTYFGDGLNYELKSDGTYKITGGSGENGVIFIPSYYSGKPVTEIADEAFQYCGLVVFMDGSNITTIGNKAFYGADFFEDIVLPASVKYIGEQAFANSSILSITLRSYVKVADGAFDSGVTIYTDADSVPDSWNFVNGHYIFFNCGLSEVGNYVETFYAQERNGFVGEIYMPYRIFYWKRFFASNQAVPYFIDEYNELQSYSFDQIMGGELPVGSLIYVMHEYKSLY